MAINAVYQTVKYEVISLKDPELEEGLKSWGVDDIGQVIPTDVLTQLRDDNAFVILNTSTNAVGVVDPVNLSLYFNEYHPSEGLSGVRKTYMEELRERLERLGDVAGTEDYFRGVNAATEAFEASQHSNASAYEQDAENHGEV